MRSEKIFFLIQQLEHLSRNNYLTFTQTHELEDLPSSILAWLFEKTIDLVDGITQLYKSNLDECGQILIRALFETYLKYIHFLGLIGSSSREEASLFVLQSIYLTREKDFLEQDKLATYYNFAENLTDLEQFKKKHAPDVLKKIKRHCFLVDHIEVASRKYHKNDEYQVMYRDFSSNAHTYDFAEYYTKRESRKNNGHIDIDYIEARKKQTFGFVFEIFIEMMTHMNQIFGLGISNELKSIKKEYSCI